MAKACLKRGAMHHMMKKWIALFLLVALIGGGQMMTGHAQAEDVWMLAVHVGKGDALLIGVDGEVCLIDTGYPNVRGRILTAMKYMGVSELSGVFITHTDKDHVGGLEWLSDSDIPVRAWYASAMYLDTSEKKHPLAVAASKRGMEAQWLKAGDRVPIGSAVFNVLAPIEMANDKDDNNSLVMMLESAEGRILLTGDIEIPAAETLLDSGAPLKCDVLKVANHGDSDAASQEFMQAASPKAAVISTSSAEKEDTPSAKVLRLLQKVNAVVACTQDAELGVLVRLKGGEPTIDLLDMSGTSTGAVIESVDAEEDSIILANTGSETVDLTDWYLYSVPGNEMMVFPKGTTIEPGKKLTVGTLSTEGGADVTWPDKKVINKKKTDTLTLYDAYGVAVSEKDNGL